MTILTDPQLIASRPNRHWFYLASLLFVLLCGDGLASDIDPRLQAGTPERRELCDYFNSVFVAAHKQLSDGKSTEQVNKQIATEAAGVEDSNGIQFVFFLGTAIADYYVSEGKSADDLSIDFRFECVTSNETLWTVMQNWVEHELPEDNPIRIQLQADDSSDTGTWQFDEDGSLLPEYYPAFLGDEFAGTQSIVAYQQREDGDLASCGVEFSHVLFDHTYNLGRPVVTNGSINVSLHPVSGLAGFIKLKATVIEINITSGEPESHFSTIDAENIYPTRSGQPIIDDMQNFECEDPEYLCQVNFSWDELMQAIINDSLGLAYKPRGGKTDMQFDLDMTRTDEISENYEKMNLCMSRLLTIAADNLPDE